MSQPVRQGIYQKLMAAPAVTNLVGDRIFHNRAKSDAAYPLIVFFKAGGSKTRAMGSNAFRHQVWTVKAVDRNTDADPVDAIAKAIDNVLDLGTITVSGSTLADLHHVGDVEYAEDRGDQQYLHAGANYRVSLT